MYDLSKFDCTGGEARNFAKSQSLYIRRKVRRLAPSSFPEPHISSYFPHISSYYFSHISSYSFIFSTYLFTKYHWQEGERECTRGNPIVVRGLRKQQFISELFGVFYGVLRVGIPIYKYSFIKEILFSWLRAIILMFNQYTRIFSLSAVFLID